LTRGIVEKLPALVKKKTEKMKTATPKYYTPLFNPQIDFTRKPEFMDKELGKIFGNQNSLFYNQKKTLPLA
jgi:hypothetical protein